MSEEIYDPRERLEIFLNAIRTGDVEDLPDPQTREEMYLLAIASKSALPDPTDASAGDNLVLDADKNPVWQTPVESKKYYYHFLKFSYSGTGYNSFYARTQIVSSSSTPFSDASGFAAWLYDNGYNSSTYPYTVVKLNMSGTIPAGEVTICEGVYSSNRTQVSVNYKVLKVENNALTYDSHALSVGSMTDTVQEI